MNQERNTLLKIHSTGEFIAWNQFDGFHLTMKRREACPFTEDEIKEQEGKWNQKIVKAGIWIIPLWKMKMNR